MSSSGGSSDDIQIQEQRHRHRRFPRSDSSFHRYSPARSHRRRYSRRHGRARNSSDSEADFDPLLMAKSDNPGAQLIPLRFTGLNFFNWSRSVKLALGAKTKLAFIDGSCRRSELGARGYHRWMRADYMVRCWLLNSMENRIAENFAFVESSLQLWTELTERYGQTNGPLLFQLRRSLSSIQQGTRTVEEYYSALKKLWDEISALEESPQCSCGAFLSCSCDLVKKVLEKDSRHQLMEFLMGLNSDFDVVRSSILSTDPLPAVNKAFYLVEHIERQKSITNVVSEFLGTDVMACSANGKKFYQNKNNSGSGRQKSVRICENCNVKGHSKERCYKLIGYPDNWKFKDGKGPSVFPGNSINKDNNANLAVFDNPLENNDGFANVAQHTTLDQVTLDRVCQGVVNLMRGGEGPSCSVASTSFAGPYH